jgi:hypothetical protein
VDAVATIVRRLRCQRLTGASSKTPKEVVGWLGAVQAQDFAEAKWSLGERLRRGTDDQVERAFAAGEILRTHVMRPTWHFVAREDIRWLLRLTAPRVHAANGSLYRKLGLDAELLSRSHEIVAKALADGRALTRSELAASLAVGGIEAESVRLAYILMHAELEQLICSGPRRASQQTYMLFDDRAPPESGPSGDAALAELARRYFRSHGPATVRDFVWWSGLKVADARRGLEGIRDELRESSDEQGASWFIGRLPRARAQPADAFLIPMYDELGVAHRDLRVVLARQPPRDGLLNRPIVIDGLTFGSWSKAVSRRQLAIEATLFAKPDRRQAAALEAAAERFGRFVGRTATVATESVSNC